MTGGSRGLGMAFAHVLAEAGADVAITARDPLRARAAVDLMESLGRRAIAVDADVTDPAWARPLTFGRLRPGVPFS